MTINVEPLATAKDVIGNEFDFDICRAGKQKV
jgi:hypothetical protein